MDGLIKKRLVFSFYLDENTFENEANILHFKLLRRYLPQFDEVVFVIIKNDNIPPEMVKRLQRLILTFYNGDIFFKLYPNTEYKESYVFKKEIVDKMKTLDGYTLFGHNKGITNMTWAEKDEIKKWICGLYYFNFPPDFISELNNFNRLFFGAFKTDIAKHSMFHDSFMAKWLYSGTFYWGNYQTIDRYIRKMNIELPPLSDRWYDENWPGTVCKQEYGFTWGQRYVVGSPVNYDNVDSWLQVCYPPECGIYQAFIDFYNEIENEIWDETLI